MLKTIQKTLLISALLAVPFAAAQAHETAAAHEAWIKAQKIDVQPTLKVSETQIPADSAGGSTGSSAPGTTMPSSSMPSSQMVPGGQGSVYPSNGMGAKTQ
jgi:hypothetical protein